METEPRQVVVAGETIGECLKKKSRRRSPQNGDGTSFPLPWSQQPPGSHSHEAEKLLRLVRLIVVEFVHFFAELADFHDGVDESGEKN